MEAPSQLTINIGTREMTHQEREASSYGYIDPRVEPLAIDQIVLLLRQRYADEGKELPPQEELLQKAKEIHNKNEEHLT